MTTARLPSVDDEEEEAVSANLVELALPARPELLYLARMTAAAVASRCEFGYDQIEDLRLALDELCLTLLEGRSAPGRMRLQFSWSDETIEVTTTVEDEEKDTSPKHQRLSATPRPNELSERILDALVDAHVFDHQAGVSRSWLRVRRKKVGN